MNLSFRKFPTSIKNLRKAAVLGVSAPALVLCALSAQATDLVVNGGFETNTGNGQVGATTTATGWSMAGSPNYTFLFAPGTADTTGAGGQYGSLWLWGSNNGGTSVLTTSPNGGYFIAADSTFQRSALEQTINGLTAGDKYTVNFDWAAAQQYAFDGPTSDTWTVSLGAQSFTTPSLAIADKGFSGWTSQSYTFTATSGSEVLSFLADGTPTTANEPPFALLDGVSLTTASTPEPSTLPLIFSGLMGGLGLLRSKKWLKS